MTIEEYKEKFIQLYNQLEKEHGCCKLVAIQIETEIGNECFYDKIVKCKIEF